MISIPTIDELRQTRRRLAEQAGLDVQRYAALLQAASGQQRPGTYVVAPPVTSSPGTPATRP